jgi:hypothetical protein
LAAFKNKNIVFTLSTYAQNLCFGAANQFKRDGTRYQTHSDCKLLIYIDFQICFFRGQSGKSLDGQGFMATQDKFSTKLSTETRDYCPSSLKSTT